MNTHEHSSVVPLLLRTPYGDLHISMAEQLSYPSRFFFWVQHNWTFYKLFVEKSRDMKAWGRRRCSAKFICEGIRWETEQRQKKENTFKVNNNYTSGLARLAMRQFPIELNNFFECRGRDGMDHKQEHAA